MNAQSPRKWWSILKSAVFGLNSSLPPLVGGGGGLVCESVVKADLLSYHFDGWQSRESVDQLLTFHPSSRFTSFAFSSSEVRRLLLGLVPYESSGPLRVSLFLFFLRELLMFIFFFWLSVVFQRLVRLGCSQACWRQANVTQFQRVHRPLLLQTTDIFP